jgi:hypothetical protein
MSAARIILFTIRLFVKHKSHNIIVNITCYNSLFRKIFFYKIIIQIMFYFLLHIHNSVFEYKQYTIPINDFTYFEYY